MGQRGPRMGRFCMEDFFVTVYFFLVGSHQTQPMPPETRTVREFLKSHKWWVRGRGSQTNIGQKVTSNCMICCFYKHFCSFHFFGTQFHSRSGPVPAQEPYGGGRSWPAAFSRIQKFPASKLDRPPTLGLSTPRLGSVKRRFDCFDLMPFIWATKVAVNC